MLQANRPPETRLRLGELIAALSLALVPEQQFRELPLTRIRGPSVALDCGARRRRTVAGPVARRDLCERPTMEGTGQCVGRAPMKAAVTGSRNSRKRTGLRCDPVESFE